MAISAETLDDAHKMLDFVARKGIHINDNEVRAIVEIENGAMSGASAEIDTIVKFWEAFATLCSSARPATLSMIKAGVPRQRDRPRWSDSRQWFPAVGVVLFAAVAAAQVYAGVGGRLVSAFKEERASYVTQAREIIRSQQTVSALEAVKVDAKGEQKTKIEEQLKLASQELQSQFAQWTSTDTRTKLYLERLDGWNNTWQLVGRWLRRGYTSFLAIVARMRTPEGTTGVARAAIVAEAPRSAADAAGDTGRPAQGVAATVTAPSGHVKDAFQYGPEAPPPTASLQETPGWLQSSDKEYRHTAALLDAGTVLDAFQSLILPFLYGALGSCVLLLKRHSEEIADGITSPRFTYRVRLALGCMAGVAIGWVSTLLITEDAQTLAPQTLAFLAGYNVEMLAAALDKISFR